MKSHAAGVVEKRGNAPSATEVIKECNSCNQLCVVDALGMLPNHKYGPLTRNEYGKDVSSPWDLTPCPFSGAHYTKKAAEKTDAERPAKGIGRRKKEK